MRLSFKSKKKLEEDNIFYINVGKKLRLARRSKINEFTGKQIVIPQTKVANELKTTFQQIGKYEKGANRIPLISLIKISKFLKKPLSYFLSDYQEQEILSEKFNNAFKIELEKLQESK